MGTSHAIQSGPRPSWFRASWGAAVSWLVSSLLANGALAVTCIPSVPAASIWGAIGDAGHVCTLAPPIAATSTKAVGASWWTNTTTAYRGTLESRQVGAENGNLSAAVVREAEWTIVDFVVSGPILASGTVSLKFIYEVDFDLGRDITIATTVREPGGALIISDQFDRSASSGNQLVGSHVIPFTTSSFNVTLDAGGQAQLLVNSSLFLSNTLDGSNGGAFSNTVRLHPDATVMNLPAGWDLDSTDLGIVDNQWFNPTAVPSVGLAALAALAALLGGTGVRRLRALA